MSNHKRRSLARRRPAETGTGVAGAIVAVLALMGVPLDEASTEQLVVLVGAIAAAPALITSLVERLRTRWS